MRREFNTIGPCNQYYTEADVLYSDEFIDGKRIYTYIVRTQFDRPSRLGVPDELKRTT